MVRTAAEVNQTCTPLEGLVDGLEVLLLESDSGSELEERACPGEGQVGAVSEYPSPLQSLAHSAGLLVLLVPFFAISITLVTLIMLLLLLLLLAIEHRCG